MEHSCLCVLRSAHALTWDRVTTLWYSLRFSEIEEFVQCGRRRRLRRLLSFYLVSIVACLHANTFHSDSHLESCRCADKRCIQSIGNLFGLTVPRYVAASAAACRCLDIFLISSVPSSLRTLCSCCDELAKNFSARRACLSMTERTKTHKNAQRSFRRWPCVLEEEANW